MGCSMIEDFSFLAYSLNSFLVVRSKDYKQKSEHLLNGNNHLALSVLGVWGWEPVLSAPSSPGPWGRAQFCRKAVMAPDRHGVRRYD